MRNKNKTKLKLEKKVGTRQSEKKIGVSLTNPNRLISSPSSPSSFSLSFYLKSRLTSFSTPLAAGLLSVVRAQRTTTHTQPRLAHIIKRR